MVDRLKFFVAKAIGFAWEIAKLDARMTALEPPITAFFAVNDIMRKAVSIIRSKYLQARGVAHG